MRNPKQMTEWLELDYFERPRKLRRWKRWLLLIVLVASGASVACAFLPYNKPAFQAGPVSEPHALFQHDCQACHVEPFATTKRLVPGLDAHTSMDMACEKCHAGPPHHLDVASYQPGCAVCHREHRGLEQLVRVDDRSCTNCHGNLAAASKPEARTAYQDVTAFASGQHPEFNLWRSKVVDPGTLRFNHALHLDEVGVADATGSKQVLDCQSCHKPDDSGRFMKPVTYQQHCQQCHQLRVAVVGDWTTEAQKKAASAFQQLPAPHDKPMLVRGTLQARYLDFVRQNPEVIGQEAASAGRPIPGNPPPRQVIDDQFSWVNGQLDKAERLLFQGGGGCQYCHQVASWQKDGLPVIADPNMQKRWFKSARFGHDSHRLLDCQQCHASKQSSQSADVLMPDVNSCLQCHRPGAARSDCALCHTYHDREREGAFRGTLTIKDCTRGASWPR
ncbi:MAG: hypothetical protein AB7K24_22905 [Gemmataceae bacterium]